MQRNAEPSTREMQNVNAVCEPILTEHEKVLEKMEFSFRTMETLLVLKGEQKGKDALRDLVPEIKNIRENMESVRDLIIALKVKIKKAATKKEAKIETNPEPKPRITRSNSGDSDTSSRLEQMGYGFLNDAEELSPVSQPSKPAAPLESKPKVSVPASFINNARLFAPAPPRPSSAVYQPGSAISAAVQPTRYDSSRYTSPFTFHNANSSLGNQSTGVRPGLGQERPVLKF